MIKLQTPVIDEKCEKPYSFSDKIMMLGSCFTDSIGKHMLNYGFDVCVNPFGTLYNPISILNSITRLAQGRPFCDDDCERMGAGSELTCSFSHHTSHARKDRETFLADANSNLEKASAFFRESDKVIITLGTSWCFRHGARNTIVSNCLKRPAAEFTRVRLSLEEVKKSLEEIISICRDGRGGKKKDILFTVSPIRHFKDGAHGNQLSKATLLLGIDEVLREGVDYFPAYEIMMDELRDYRFYSEDMCHPSEQAVNYIRDRFLQWALHEKERPQLEENIRNYRRSCHRPLNAE